MISRLWAVSCSAREMGPSTEPRGQIAQESVKVLILGSFLEGTFLIPQGLSEN
jgi:hypothetical protein